MAGLSHLKLGAAPAVGLRKQDYKNASLHGDTLQTQQTRKSSSPISAPPRISSSDEELYGQDVPDDGYSDDSEFGRRERMGNPNSKVALGVGTNFVSAKGEDSKKGELTVEPSNIRAGSFALGKRPGSRNGSQSSQKRRGVDVDDDDLSVAFSQSKKPRQSYGSTNKHRSSAIKSGSPRKAPPKESGKAGPVYRHRDIREMQDRGRGSLCMGF